MTKRGGTAIPSLAGKRVLILGGGFGGVYCALALASREPHLRVTLVSRDPRFVFKPLLYDLLTDEVPGKRPQNQNDPAGGAGSFTDGSFELSGL